MAHRPFLEATRGTRSPSARDSPSHALPNFWVGPRALALPSPNLAPRPAPTAGTAAGGAPVLEMEAHVTDLTQCSCCPRQPGSQAGHWALTIQQVRAVQNGAETTGHNHHPGRGQDGEKPAVGDVF